MKNPYREQLTINVFYKNLGRLQGSYKKRTTFACRFKMFLICPQYFVLVWLYLPRKILI